MPQLLSQLFPLLYGLCFLALLWQAFRVMARGFGAASTPIDRSRQTSGGGMSDDRTGRLTIHPELLDADGQITNDDLLTVRFSGDNEQPALPNDPN